MRPAGPAGLDEMYAESKAVKNCACFRLEGVCKEAPFTSNQSDVHNTRNNVRNNRKDGNNDSCSIF